VYGYDKQGTRRETCYITNEEQASVIRIIFHLYVYSRLSTMQIAWELNNQQVPPPAIAKGIQNLSVSGKWNDQTVRRILNNSAYKGLLIGYQTATIDGEIRAIPKDEQVIITIPAIVDEDLWDRAQYLLEHTRGLIVNRPQIRDYLLSSLTLCTCGHMMAGTCEKPRNRYYFYYRCNTYTTTVVQPRCRNRKVKADALEYTVWDFIDRLVTDTQTTIAIYEQEHQATASMLTETRQRLEAIDELVVENHEEKHRLNQMYQKKRCDEAYFEAEWTRLTEEEEALYRERDKAMRVLEKQQASGRQMDELEAISAEIRTATGELTFERKRHFLERLRCQVTVEPAGEGGTRWLIIEVLGHKRRVCLKTHSTGCAT
jgi:Recombinase/Recombinase zinc beta ribbon domain